MTETLSTNAATPAGPWRLTLVTNPDDCTLACDMCPCGLARGGAGPAPGGSGGQPPRRMAPALALAVLEERRGSALREVIPSTRGEPLLWSGLDALLDACGRLGLLVNVTTNGTFPGRGPAAWGEALLPRASDVKISWNGATARTAEAIMPGLDFAAAVDGVRRFAAVRDRLAAAGGRRATLSFQVTAQEGNVAELPDVVRLAARLGVDRVKLNHLQPWFPHLAARSLRRSPAAIARWDAAAAAARAAAGEVRLPSGAPVVLQNAVPLAPAPAVAVAPDAPCPFAGREAWIRWDGALVPCPHPEADQAFGALGSVAAAPLGALWAAAPFRAFLAGVPAHPLCRGCAFRRPGGG
jgi:MoaA/NifB/PqqE/SkfB family radical SAM enzyme